MSHCWTPPNLTSPHQLRPTVTEDSSLMISGIKRGPFIGYFTLNCSPVYVDLLSWKWCLRATVSLKCVLSNPYGFYKNSQHCTVDDAARSLERRTFIRSCPYTHIGWFLFAVKLIFPWFPMEYMRACTVMVETQSIRCVAKGMGYLHFHQALLLLVYIWWHVIR